VPARGVTIDALALAITAGLTVYDAMYLALAVRLKTELITADERLSRIVAAHPMTAAQVRLVQTFALKKSELYASLWSSCDELRAGMGAGEYKDPRPRSAVHQIRQRQVRRKRLRRRSRSLRCTAPDWLDSRVSVFRRPV